MNFNGVLFLPKRKNSGVPMLCNLKSLKCHQRISKTKMRAISCSDSISVQIPNEGGRYSVQGQLLFFMLQEHAMRFCHGERL